MKIMVLSDGETFSTVDGCAIYEVPDGLDTEGIEAVLADGAAGKNLMSNAEAKRIFECENCGVSVRLSQRSDECPVCGEKKLHAVPYGSGYDEPHMLGIWARADMLERVGGLTLEQQDRELSFALSAADHDDPGTLRWLAVLIESRLGALFVSQQPRARVIAQAKTMLGQGDPSNLDDSAEQEKFAGAEDRIVAAALNQIWMNHEADDDVRTLDGRAVQIGPFILYVADGGAITTDTFDSDDAASLKISELVEEFEKGGED